ncbi:lactonase [Aureococcus anophagefferens]|nr:lactonase [Aureococcus anophagefferens]
MTSLIAVSSYTDTDILAHTPKGAENDQGITCFWLDHATGSLKPAGGADHPTEKDVVYASTERIDEDGSVYSLRLARDDAADGVSLRVVDEATAKGKSTCYLAVDKSGRWLRLTNYWEASVCVLPIEGAAIGACADAHFLPPGNALQRAAKDGSLQPVAPRCDQPSSYCVSTKPSREEHWTYRQRWPHAHCCVTEPYEKNFHFVVDLGEDAVYHYEMDEAVGKMACLGSTRLARGGGPRHVVFHPTRKAAFLVNELASTVSCFTVDLANATKRGVKSETDDDAVLRLAPCGPQSTLPAGYDNAHHCVNGIWKAKSHSSEIRLDAAGDWLFVGNRGHDSLAVFKVSFDAAGQVALELAHCHPTGGKCPRNFAVLDRHVVLGNQDTNELVVLERNLETGSLARVSAVPHNSPNYVARLDAPPALPALPEDPSETIRAPLAKSPSSKASLLDAFAPPAPARAPTPEAPAAAATTPQPPKRRRPRRRRRRRRRPSPPADGGAPAKKAPVKKAPAKKAPPKAAPKPTGPVLTNSAQYSRQSQYELGWFGKFDDAKTGDERSKKILARFDKVGGNGEQARTPERVRAEIEAIEARKAAAVARIKGGN